MQDYKMPYREQESNKGTFGKILNVAGSKNYIGAAYLSSISALKTGAGYIALATSSRIIDSVSKLLPEAVYISTNEGLKNFKNYSVLLIGCGLGTGLFAKYNFKKFINVAVRNATPTVIDADGLNILAKTKNLQLPPHVIITPHPMEAARLLKKDLKFVLNNLEESAKMLCKKYNCVTVLKTHRTLICDGDIVYTNQFGNSALAKAGTGDVLAGIISGLIAQKMPACEAAKLGVYLHSRAGEIASEELTEYSVAASDIVKYLPMAIREIL